MITITIPVNYKLSPTEIPTLQIDTKSAVYYQPIQHKKEEEIYVW